MAHALCMVTNVEILYPDPEKLTKRTVSEKPAVNHRCNDTISKPNACSKIMLSCTIDGVEVWIITTNLVGLIIGVATREVIQVVVIAVVLPLIRRLHQGLDIAYIQDLVIAECRQVAEHLHPNGAG